MHKLNKFKLTSADDWGLADIMSEEEKNTYVAVVSFRHQLTNAFKKVMQIKDDDGWVMSQNVSHLLSLLKMSCVGSTDLPLAHLHPKGSELAGKSLQLTSEVARSLRVTIEIAWAARIKTHNLSGLVTLIGENKGVLPKTANRATWRLSPEPAITDADEVKLEEFMVGLSGSVKGFCEWALGETNPTDPGKVVPRPLAFSLQALGVNRGRRTIGLPELCGCAWFYLQAPARS